MTLDRRSSSTTATSMCAASLAGAAQQRPVRSEGARTVAADQLVGRHFTSQARKAAFVRFSAKRLAWHRTKSCLLSQRPPAEPEACRRWNGSKPFSPPDYYSTLHFQYDGFSCPLSHPLAFRHSCVFHTGVIPAMCNATVPFSRNPGTVKLRESLQQSWRIYLVLRFFVAEYHPRLFFSIFVKAGVVFLSSRLAIERDASQCAPGLFGY
jgi:hypothetical protein